MPIDDFIYFFYEIDAEYFELCYEELGKEGFKESLENNELALYLKRGKRKVHKVSSSLKLHLLIFSMFMNFFQLMNVILKTKSKRRSLNIVGIVLFYRCFFIHIPTMFKLLGLLFVIKLYVRNHIFKLF